MGDFKKHSRGGVIVSILNLFIVAVILWWQYDKNVSVIYQKWWVFPICFALTYLGALLPDVDTGSISRRIIYTVFLALTAFLIVTRYYSWAAVLGFFAIGFSIFKHRSFLHSYIFALLIPVPFLIIPIIITGRLKDIGLVYYLSTSIGVFTHIILDEKK